MTNTDALNQPLPEGGYLVSVTGTMFPGDKFAFYVIGFDYESEFTTYERAVEACKVYKIDVDSMFVDL